MIAALKDRDAGEDQAVRAMSGGLPGHLTDTSYTLPDGLSIDEWINVGNLLQRIEKAVGWWVGDWLNYGERVYGEDKYTQALKETPYAYKTLRNASYVSGRFDVSRRRDTLSYSHHAEVASLPPEHQQDLLTLAEEKKLSTHDLREKAKERRTEIEIEKARAQPTPEPEDLPLTARIEQADARSLPLEDGSVHLIVTSPPYGVDRPYVDGGDVAAGDWPTFMLDWLTEAYRVTAPHGRLALNIPLDTTAGGYRPTYAQAVQMADAAGWTYRSSIVWVDDHLGKSTARGSMDSAAAPHIVAGAELVALFSKDTWKRETPCPSDLAHEDWVNWTAGVWRFPGEPVAWEGHPAPFPYELPRRLILLLSFPGDVVLDPFAGSGTTVLAASKLGRQAVGFDRSSLYVGSARRRVLGIRRAS